MVDNLFGTQARRRKSMGVRSAYSLPSVRHVPTGNGGMKRAG